MAKLPGPFSSMLSLSMASSYPELLHQHSHVSQHLRVFAHHFLAESTQDRVLVKLGRVTGSVMVFPCGETLTTSLIVSLLLSLRLMPRKNGRCERPARSHVFIHCSTAVRQAPRLTPSFCLLPFIWFFCAHHVDQGSNEAWAEKEVPRVSPNSPGRKAPGGLWKGLTPGAQPLTPGTDYIFMLG